jgi:hypothetical protein
MNEWLDFFERISHCFQCGMRRIWEKYNDHPINIWNSLAIFLGSYAFERQGRNPGYSDAAVDALLACEQNNQGNLDNSTCMEIWQDFCNSLQQQNPNHKNNPLYPRNNPDNIINLRNASSLIEVVLDTRMSEQDLTLTSYLKNQIENSGIRDAFNLLKSIRGIGPKIASLYLRDLAIMMNIDLNNDNNRFLLQPIDIWVERTVIALSNQQLNKRQAADWVVNYSVRNLNQPELVNMGIWYFGSQIAKSEYNLYRVLNNIENAQCLVQDHITLLRNICREYQDLESVII